MTSTLLPTVSARCGNVPLRGLRVQAAVFVDDHRLVVTGAEPDRGTRLFVFDLGTSEHRPISPEGMDPLDVFVMPGANAVIGFTADRGYQMYPLEGGDPRAARVGRARDRIARISGRREERVRLAPGRDPGPRPTGWISRPASARCGAS
jgi:hypothetical protein